MSFIPPANSDFFLPTSDDTTCSIDSSSAESRSAVELFIFFLEEIDKGKHFLVNIHHVSKLIQLIDLMIIIYQAAYKTSC